MPGPIDACARSTGDLPWYQLTHQRRRSCFAFVEPPYQLLRHLPHCQSLFCYPLTSTIII